MKNMSNRAFLTLIGLALAAAAAFGLMTRAGQESRDGAGEQIALDESVSFEQVTDLEPLTPTEPLAVSAVELEKAFDDNEVAAQMKYGAQPVLISGRLKGIELDSSDNAVLRIDSGALLALNVTLPTAQTGAAANLHKGGKVTVLCSEVSEMLGKPVVDKCWLQDV